MSIIQIVMSLSILAISGLAAWIYNQGRTVMKLETELLNLHKQHEDLKSKVDDDRKEALTIKAFNTIIDYKIDAKLSKVTEQFMEVLNQAKLALGDLNSNMKYLTKEVEELKNKK